MPAQKISVTQAMCAGHLFSCCCIGPVRWALSGTARVSQSSLSRTMNTGGHCPSGSARLLKVLLGALSALQQLINYVPSVSQIHDRCHGTWRKSKTSGTRTVRNGKHGERKLFPEASKIQLPDWTLPALYLLVASLCRQASPSSGACRIVLGLQQWQRVLRLNLSRGSCSS